MAFTRINFNRIEDANETPDNINIKKNINFTEQVPIPLIPPSQHTDRVTVFYYKIKEETQKSTVPTGYTMTQTTNGGNRTITPVYANIVVPNKISNIRKNFHGNVDVTFK